MNNKKIAPVKIIRFLSGVSRFAISIKCRSAALHSPENHICPRVTVELLTEKKLNVPHLTNIAQPSNRVSTKFAININIRLIVVHRNCHFIIRIRF
jgi:hypothetical protein